MKVLIKKVLRMINELIPKQTGKIVFISNPDYSDNSQALYEYLVENSDYNLIWLVKKGDILARLQKRGLKAVSLNSLEGIYNLFTAQFICATHGEFAHLISGRQKLINLWHGMPLKGIGFLNDNIGVEFRRDFEQLSAATTKLVSTSKLMKSIMAACFKIDPGKVVITGQPRNDKLFNPKSRALTQELLNLDLNAYNKTIFYLPTFRRGLGKTEGEAFQTNIFNFNDYEVSAMSNFLKENKILLVIKLHPYEEESFDFENAVIPENCRLIKSTDLTDNLLGLYDLLGAFDMLITDYSSVYFDYLILDKPIIFATSDLKEYEHLRGFVFENIDFWTPGPKVQNMAEFFAATKNYLTNSEYYSKERELINSLVNTYTDDKSSERIFELIKEFK